MSTSSFLVVTWTDRSTKWVTEKARSFYPSLDLTHKHQQQAFSKLAHVPLHIKSNNDGDDDDGDDDANNSSGQQPTLFSFLLSSSGITKEIFAHIIANRNDIRIDSKNNKPSKKVRSPISNQSSTDKFVRLLERGLVVKVFGQTTCWLTSVRYAARHFGEGAVLKIDLNDDFEDENDKSSSKKCDADNETEDGSSSEHNEGLDDRDDRNLQGDTLVDLLFPNLNSTCDDDAITNQSNNSNNNSNPFLSHIVDSHFFFSSANRTNDVTTGRGRGGIVCRHLHARRRPRARHDNDDNNNNNNASGDDDVDGGDDQVLPLVDADVDSLLEIQQGKTTRKSSNFCANPTKLPSLPRSFVDVTSSRSRSISKHNEPACDDQVVVFPIVLGSVAKHRGREATSDQPFEWRIYVRGPHFEDLSSVVEKVVFRLHHTFANPIRVVDKAPFELVDYGWGQFVIGVDIHFLSERPKVMSNSSSARLGHGHDDDDDTKNNSSINNSCSFHSAAASSSSSGVRGGSFDEASGVVQDVSPPSASNAPTGLSQQENSSSFQVIHHPHQSLSSATMIVKLSHFLRFDKGPKNTTTTSAAANALPQSPPLVANNALHCIPPLGRHYTNGAENFMPDVNSDGDVPCVWEEYDELVFVRPPPRLREALRLFPYGKEAVPKKNTVSWKSFIEKFGLPTNKLANDEAEYQALLKIHAALSELVEQRLTMRAQQLSALPPHFFTTTTSAGAAANLPHSTRGWAQWRRQAESILS